MREQMSEKQIMIDVQLELAKVGVLLFRNNCGMLQDKNGTYVRYGLGTGSSDLIGWALPSGRFVAVEVKTPTGKATKEQLAFIDAVNKGGGIAFLARSAAEALEEIKKRL